MNRIDKLKALTLEGPTDTFILFALAKEYELLQKDGIAIDYYHRILDLNKFDLSVYYNLGILFEKMGNMTEAKLKFESGLSYAKKVMDFEFINCLTIKLEKY